VATTLVLGAAFDDALGRWLRLVAVSLVLLGCLVVLSREPVRHHHVAAWMLAGYVPASAVLLAGYGWLLRLRAARVGAVLALLGCLVARGWGSYDSLRRVIGGLDFIATGLVLLGLAELISLAKAGLLPWRIADKDREVHSAPD
jgi:hypothetical protein